MTAPLMQVYGTETPDPEPIALRMGAVSLLLEPHSGFVRHVKLNGEQELLNGIYPAVRDHNWNTLPATLSDFTLTQKRGGFIASYHAECKQDDIHFVWDGEIVGEPSGKLTYTFRGKALSSFLKNRIGLCILHPSGECAGRTCTIEHTDGTTTRGEFPKFISPHQPFKNIRAITHQVIWGVRATVRCEGETFEMEDQRNWTDASFKTYSTPLELSYPVRIEAGTELNQTVTLTVSGAGSESAISTKTEPISVRGEGARLYSLPALGLCLNLPEVPVSEQERERLAALNLSHLRVDVRFVAGWQDKFQREAEFANELGMSVEAALYLTADYQAELTALADLPRRLPRRLIKNWLVLSTNAMVTPLEIQEAAERTLGYTHPRQNFFVGTDAYFTEYNRNRPDNARHVCYSLNPQVHAFDTASLMETLPIQGETVRNVRRNAQQTVVAVTPVTLKPRFNPNATAEQTVSGADPRQWALCGAAWTLGSIKALAEEKTDSVTYYQVWGESGVLSENGSVSPIYHVLADVGEFKNGKVEGLGWNRTDGKLAALLLDKRGEKRLLLANLTPQELPVEAEFDARRSTLKTLDETTIEQAIREPETWRNRQGERRHGKRVDNSQTQRIRLTLRPYAVACLDGEQP
jgi:D-apionolactonase